MPRSLLIAFAVAGALAVADVAAHDFEALSPSNGKAGLFAAPTVAEGYAAAAASCGDPPTTSLSVWLDGRSIDGADNSTLANNDPITTWQDLGSIGDDPTQATSSAKPTYIASCINGKACARFDGGDRLVATTASSYIFFHNGSDWTAYVVSKTTSSNPNALQSLVATTSYAGGSVGNGIGYDDRSAVSRNDRLLDFLSNASTAVINMVSGDGAATSGSWHIVTVKLDEGAGTDATGYIDSTSVATATSGAAYATGNPAAALTIGASSSGGFLLTGDIAQVLIYTVAHNTAARGEVETWIECEYGAMPQ